MYQPETVDSIFEDFQGRRAGLVAALTHDARKLHSQCDPFKENLELLGRPDGSWEVAVPAEDVPSPLPEPCIGINFARDGMQMNDWLALVARYSDAWLMAIAFFFGNKLDHPSRALLFSRMNELPTLYEIVTGQQQNRALGAQKAPKNAPKYEEMMYKEETQESMPAQASAQPSPRGRRLQMTDIQPALLGRKGELYWPDDQMWYLTTVVEVKPRTRQAKVQYTSGEIEELDLEEIVRDGHLQLLNR